MLYSIVEYLLLTYLLTYRIRGANVIVMLVI